MPIDEELLQQIRIALVEAEANGWKTVVITGIDHLGNERVIYYPIKARIEIIGALDLARDAIKSTVRSNEDVPVPSSLDSIKTTLKSSN